MTEELLIGGASLLTGALIGVGITIGIQQRHKNKITKKWREEIAEESIHKIAAELHHIRFQLLEKETVEVKLTPAALAAQLALLSNVFRTDATTVIQEIREDGHYAIIAKMPFNEVVRI
jgi:hypothetical protein